MTIKIIDHVARAMSRLSQAFKKSTGLLSLVRVFVGQVQAAEDALGPLTAVRDPAVAEGAVLDGIGALVGAPARGTKTDAAYRARIAAQAQANRGFGGADIITTISRYVVAPWAVAGNPRITESVGAYEIACSPRGTIVNNIADAHELAVTLNANRASGYRAIVISQHQSNATSFGFLGGGALGFSGAGLFVGAYEG
jgi:hypothetical protein